MKRPMLSVMEACERDLSVQHIAMQGALICPKSWPSTSAALTAS